jgi:predicted ATPase
MSTRAVEVPLIGREPEAERLRDALRRMVDDGGHVVLITGEAGIGKSRLMAELVRSATASGAAISLGLCHETEQTLPLRPWIEALRSDGAVGASIRDRLSATATAQLAPIFPELQRPGDTPGASAVPAPLDDPLLELIGTLASDQPRVIIV